MYKRQRIPSAGATLLTTFCKKLDVVPLPPSNLSLIHILKDALTAYMDYVIERDKEYDC